MPAIGPNARRASTWPTPLLTPRTRTSASRAAVTTRRPSSLNVTSVSGFVCPRRIRYRLPVRANHSRPSRRRRRRRPAARRGRSSRSRPRRERGAGGGAVRSPPTRRPRRSVPPYDLVAARRERGVTHCPGLPLRPAHPAVRRRHTDATVLVPARDEVAARRDRDGRHRPVARMHRQPGAAPTASDRLAVVLPGRDHRPVARRPDRREAAAPDGAQRVRPATGLLKGLGCVSDDDTASPRPLTSPQPHSAARDETIETASPA